MTQNDLDIFARTLYGEARGEYDTNGVAAFIAVGNVIMNRFKRKKYGETIADVCLKPRQFPCWNQCDPNRILIQDLNLNDVPLFRGCINVGKMLMEGTWPDLTRDSDHYHAKSIRPYWARKARIKLQLGNHIFYKLDE